MEPMSIEDLMALPEDVFSVMLNRVLSARNRRRGTQPPPPPASPLATLAVGESCILRASKLHHSLRDVARRRMGDPNAQWKSRALSNGTTRVTRTR